MRVAIVSPFLDRQHGTERCLVEQIERFLQHPDCEIHIYSQSVRDLEVVPFSSGQANSSITRRAIWHRVPALPMPHLFNFLWWYFANQGLRWFHRTFRSLHYDVIFSPGINCSDADAIAAHVVFHEFFRQAHQDLRLRDAPLSAWPVLLHRSLYYRLIMALENRIYRNPRISLATVSNRTAEELARHFARSDVSVIPNAVDLARFNLPERLRRRGLARKFLQLPDDEFVLLLIGNDWKSKGLAPLLNAVALLQRLPLRLLVVGRDNSAPFLALIQRLGLAGRVLFQPPSSDIMQFYAAADVYTGPSLHDSFALPPLEAMACGLPVITSITNGGSQIITEGVDGFVLKDAQDSVALSGLISHLYERPELRRSIGENSARTAQSYSWERNASKTWQFLTKAAASSLKQTSEVTSPQ